MSILFNLGFWHACALLSPWWCLMGNRRGGGGKGNKKMRTPKKKNTSYAPHWSWSSGQYPSVPLFGRPCKESLNECPWWLGENWICLGHQKPAVPNEFIRGVCGVEFSVGARSRVPIGFMWGWVLGQGWCDSYDSSLIYFVCIYFVLQTHLELCKERDGFTFLICLSTAWQLEDKNTRHSESRSELTPWADLL